MGQIREGAGTARTPHRDLDLRAILGILPGALPVAPAVPFAVYRAVALVASVAAASTLALGLPASGHVDPRARLAAGIRRATGLQVSDAEVVFETARPLTLGDALRPRAVVFCARSAPAALRDVYRAQVRVLRDGTVLSLDRATNLTRTPLGDDGPLYGDRPGAPDVSRRVAFPTRAFGKVQSVAVLDLGAAREPSPSLRRGVTNLRERGAWRGLTRWDLRLDEPADDVVITVREGAVVARAGARRWVIDLARDAVEPTAGAVLARESLPDKPVVIWAVDTVRAVPWIGPAPIAWLEERVFSARDALRQTAWRWFHVRPDRPDETPEAPVIAEGNTLNTADDARDASWPPPRIAPPLGDGERGEGEWAPSSPPWLRAIEGAPPAFYRTFLRLDRERPYARVLLLAMDMRQMELSMQAGSEDPVPLVGARGDGRIPRRPEVLSRVVGAFNGAFKTEHGEYGMVVDRRVLLPPRPRAATIARLADGRTAMGTWGESAELPPEIISLRQNLDPLVEDGVENPRRRSLWGFVLGGIETMPTVRSGVCADDHGHLFYVWGEETTGRLLARAMHRAGCTYGMHLDMNPTHAAFHHIRVDDLARRQVQAQVLVRAMQSNPDRFIYFSAKDFFYLTLRDPRPRAPAGVAWEPLPTQPAPRWLPALYGVERALRDGSAARVTSLDLARVRLALRAGRAEPAVLQSGGDAVATTLAPREGDVVLGAIELGTARNAGITRGLRVDGRLRMAFSRRPGTASMSLGDSAMRFVEGEVTDADAVQGALLLRDGRDVTDAPSERGRPRVVLARTGDGRLLVVETEGGDEALRDFLRTYGATDALSFDAGAGAARSHWAGAAEPVRDAYPSTTLFVLAAPMPSPVVRLGAARANVAPGASSR